MELRYNLHKDTHRFCAYVACPLEIIMLGSATGVNCCTSEKSRKGGTYKEVSVRLNVSKRRKEDADEQEWKLRCVLIGCDR